MTQFEKLSDEIELLRPKTDSDIDYSDIPETDDNWFETAELVMELTPAQPKEKISIFVDREVLDFFKKSGDGYQTRINAVLKGYVWEKKKQSTSADRLPSI
ncbi:MAG: BrnA antitoxin family protein [Synergistaceae bacterium]|jgi:uncharacterized protein (DUF4415 family)|nr:BrnA antitoxin family protein [Synergistaceae bacterium]